MYWDELVVRGEIGTTDARHLDRIASGDLKFV